jgi:hypothetical protein
MKIAYHIRSLITIHDINNATLKELNLPPHKFVRPPCWECMKLENTKSLSNTIILIGQFSRHLVNSLKS